MLDAHFIRENLAAVKANCQNRNVQADVDRIVSLDDERKRLVQETQVKQQEANASAKEVGREKDPTKKQALIQRGRQLRDEVGQLEVKLKAVETDLRSVLSTIP